MIIRHANAQDSEQVLSLMKQLAIFEGYINNFEVTDKVIKAQINHSFYALVADDGNKIVGLLVYYFLPFTYDMAPWLFIKELYVDENSRGQNIGQLLMLKAQNICQQKGGSRMTWSVLSTNFHAQNFYQSLGASHDKDWQLYSKKVKQ